MELKSIVSNSELSAKDLFRKLSVVKNFEKIIQKLTDTNIENIEKILAEKEKEISQI